ncbi:MAG: DUF3054 domain-containing protein [Acidipropionibacterium sp.]|jgi:FtsH-binding integral membrane protein|nr:DUF3054 domain-containing protein [Acidipropionibacterium sp.]
MSHSKTTASGQVRLTVVMDILAVLIFAIIGRLAHQETLNPGGLMRTVVPFLAGLVVGWIIVVVGRLPAAEWRAGLVVWACTLVLGMAMRHFTHQGVVLSFVIVAAIFLALFLIGWRVVAGLVRRRR